MQSVINLVTERTFAGKEQEVTSMTMTRTDFRIGITIKLTEVCAGHSMDTVTTVDEMGKMMGRNNN